MMHPGEASVRPYLYFLAGIVLLSSLLAASYVWQLNSETSQAEERVRNFHLSTVLLLNRIELEMYELQSTRRNESENTPPESLLRLNSNGSIFLIRRDFESVLELQRTYSDPAVVASLRRAEKQLEQLLRWLGSERSVGNAQESGLGERVKPLRATLEQLTRLHSISYDASLLDIASRRDRDFRILVGIGFAILLIAFIAIRGVQGRADATIAKLSRAQRRFQALVQAAPDGIVGVDRDGRITLVNQRALELFGYSASDLVGEPLETLVPEQFRAAYGEHRGEYLKAPSTRPMGKGLTHSARRKDGSEFEAEISLSPMETEEGILTTAIIRDITERRRLETRLRQAQKMEAVGRLSAGVAHDFNNILMIIQGYAEILLTLESKTDKVLQTAKEILGATHRATALVQQLLAFSRRQVLSPKVLDLNVVVEGTEQLLRRLIGEDIRVVTHLDPALGRVNADPDQLGQIILNLAINARDAMPEGGMLTIETANVEFGEEYLIEHPIASPGRFSMLAMTDTGVGMSNATQAQVFEPFFTTKTRGQGTGLGLSTVYGIVKQSDGFIWVYSEPGKGTTFKLYFPHTDDVSVATPETKAAAKHLEGTETILVVEDDDGVRKLARQYLESSGYEVLESANGRQAILMARNHVGRIHLLLTDIVMPEMDGRELASQLESVCPGIEVLFVSGYTDNVVVHHGILEKEVDFLQKPYALDALGRKLREMLARGKNSEDSSV